MAHKKGVGSTDNGRDSNSKRLGVKLYGGQFAKAGNIIVRQRGTKFHPGENVYMGKDFTLHAAVNGTISFRRRKSNRTYISVIPQGAEAVATAAPAPPKAKKEKVEKAPEAPAAEVTEKAAAPAPEKEAKVKAKPEAPKKEEKAEAKKEEAPKKEKKAEAKKEEAPKKKAPAKKTEKITLPSGKKIKPDDLKAVEGIGPKIEGLLQDAGINTWEDLANAPTEKVQEVLDNAGPRYRMHDPATWSKQAALCAAGKWEELEAYQDELKGGRKA